MDKIGILDFGGQYTQLIARRIRELGVYSEILPCTQPLDEVVAAGYKGLVLSGGPSSVYEEDAPLPDKKLFEAGVPLLGICYGMQAMGYLLGGHVVPAERREYGAAQLQLEGAGGLRRARRLVHALLRRRRAGVHPPPGGHGSGSLRALGRRGLVGRRRADPPRRRRPAHLSLRRQRPPPRRRGGERGENLSRRVQDP